MPSRRRQVRSGQAAHRARDTPSISASSTVEDYGPILLYAPSSFTQCIPSNITWTGGIAPYSLLVMLGDSSETLMQVDGINATHFLLTPDVPANTFLSLQIIDERSVITSTQDPILVSSSRGLNAACQESLPGDPTPILLPSITTFTSPLSLTSSVASTTLSPSPSSLPPMQSVPRHSPVNGGTIAVIVVGVVIFLLLASFPWWRSRVTARRRENRSDDAEKQEVVSGESAGPGQGESQWDDGESTHTHTHSIPGPLDRRLSPVSNPFEDPENALYTEEIFAASPVSESDADDTTSGPTAYFFIGALPSSPRPTRSTGTIPAGRLRHKVVPTPRPSSPAARSDSDTQTLSDTDAARLSISTSSTLPPSYRTRRSAGSIYIPPPDYPLFPPPVYTPQPTGAPPPSLPSAFRPQRPRGDARRRRPAPTPPKASDSLSASATSGEWEPARPDGVRRGSTRIRDADRVEGSGTGEGNVDAGSDPFSDSRRVSLERPLAVIGTDTITTRVYAEDVGVGERVIDREIHAADSERT